MQVGSAMPFILPSLWKAALKMQACSIVHFTFPLQTWVGMEGNSEMACIYFSLVPPSVSPPLLGSCMNLMNVNHRGLDQKLIFLYDITCIFSRPSLKHNCKSPEGKRSTKVHFFQILLPCLVYPQVRKKAGLACYYPFCSSLIQRD